MLGNIFGMLGVRYLANPGSENGINLMFNGEEYMSDQTTKSARSD